MVSGERVLNVVEPAASESVERFDALFERFYRELIAEVFGEVVGGDVLRFLLEETGVIAGFYASFDKVLLDGDSVWYAGRDRDVVFRRVAERVLQPPVETWGERQRFTMSNMVVGGRLPRWLGFDVGPLPLRGTRATVHQGQIFTAGGRRVVVAASYRMIADLAERTLRTALPGGPSERRLSRWYTSEVSGWLHGRTKAVSPDDAPPERAIAP